MTEVLCQIAVSGSGLQNLAGSFIPYNDRALKASAGEPL
jgi:hypothetical protein